MMTRDGQEVRFATEVSRRAIAFVALAAGLVGLLLLAERLYFQVEAETAMARQVAAKDASGRVLLADEILTASADALFRHRQPQ